VKRAKAGDYHRTISWVQEVVQHPQGAEAGIRSAKARRILPVTVEALEEMILPSPEASALERIDLYAGMYYARLVDIMAQDFTGVKFVMGEDAFREIAYEFVHRHPSTHPSLTHLGTKFPQYLLKEVPKLKHREFLVELARLEWSLEEAFDEMQAEPLTEAALQAVPPEQWAKAKLVAIPALRLHAFEYPVNDFFGAFREYTEGAPLPRVPKPKKSWMCAFRRNFSLRRMDLTREGYEVLSRLVAGKPLGKALDEVNALKGIKPAELAANLQTWFRDWTSLGLFSAVKLR